MTFQPWMSNVTVIDVAAERLVHLCDNGLVPNDDDLLACEFKAQVCGYFVNDFISDMLNEKPNTTP